MEEKYKELLKNLYAILKPLGYRKEASDYRLFRPDGLARIVNIQRNKNNTAQCCMFTINIGVYFEKRRCDYQIVNLKNMTARLEKE